MEQELHRLERSIAAADKKLDAITKQHVGRAADSIEDQALRSHLVIANNAANIDELTVRRAVAAIEARRDHPDAKTFLRRRDERASLAALKVPRRMSRTHL
jgi:hypothetical protein